jgi:hypothetical protein
MDYRRGCGKLRAKVDLCRPRDQVFKGGKLRFESPWDEERWRDVLGDIAVEDDSEPLEVGSQQSLLPFNA